jgi:hypothetical protein
MTDIVPKLKPIFHSLCALQIGEYLASIDFDRHCIKCGLEEIWDSALREFKRTRTLYSDWHTASWERKESLRIFLNTGYRYPTFGNMFYVILLGFITSLKTKKDFTQVFEDLELIKFDTKLLADLKDRYEKNQQEIIINEPVKAVELNILKQINIYDGLKIKQKEWLKLIPKVKTETVLEQITTYATEQNDRDLMKKITKLSTRWYQNENTFKDGIITHEAKLTESNRLNDVLTDLIMDLNH